MGHPGESRSRGGQFRTSATETCEDGVMLEPGSTLPSFTALDQDGAEVNSEDWRGRWTVLWWYVKADTPG